MFRKTPLITALILFALSAGAVAGSWKKKLKIDGLNQPAPELVFQDAKGSAHSIAEYRGKPLIVHFWATWCKPCRLEIPELASRFGGGGSGRIRFIPIAIDSAATQEEIARFIHAMSAPIPDYRINEKKSSKDYQSWGVPVTYFIDERGVIVARALGSRNWAALSKEDFAGFIGEIFFQNK